MKSSLVWRFAVIGLVIAGWTYSLFPIKDQDYIAEFQELARPKIASYQKQIAKAEKKVGKLQATMDVAEDKASENYKKLQAEKVELDATATTARELIKQFDDLLVRTEKELEKNPNFAPYMALRDAAKGGESLQRVRLRNFVDVPTQPTASNSLVLSYVRHKASGKLHLGLDLRGGTEFVIGFNKDAVPSNRRSEDVRDQIVEILRNRVDSMGVVEPEIKPIGPSSISLRMPSVSEGDKADIRRTIKQTAKLEFRVVDPQNSQKVAEYRQDPKKFRPTRGYKYYEMEVERDGQVDIEILFLKSMPERLRGEDVDRAIATFNEMGSYAVSLTFNSKGAASFAKITADNVGQRLAIVLDNKVYSAPVIREAIGGGSAQISGSFSPEESRRLAG